MDGINWLKPRHADGFLAGSAEFFGGLFILLGLLTRPAAVALAFTMMAFSRFTLKMACLCQTTATSLV